MIPQPFPLNPYPYEEDRPDPAEYDEYDID